LVDPQFCASRFNHVILQLPLPNDTCWLECTSKITPFDFAGRSTASHHALIVKDQGSYLTQVRDYEMNQSLISQSSELYYNAGQTRSVHKIEFDQLDFDAYLSLTKLNEKDLHEWLADRLYGSNPLVEEVTVQRDDSLRTLALRARVNEGEVYKKLGKYLVVNPLRLKSDLPVLPEDAHREKPIYFPYDAEENTKVKIAIPKGYQLKSLPPATTSKNEFGSYQLTYHQTKESVVVSFNCQLKKQELAAERYAEIRDFLQVLKTIAQQKIVFTPA